MDTLNLLWSFTPAYLGTSEKGLDYIQDTGAGFLLATDGTIFALYKKTVDSESKGYYLPKDKTDPKKPYFSNNLLSFADAVKIYPTLRALQLKDIKDPFGIMESPGASRYDWLDVQNSLNALEKALVDSKEEFVTLDLKEQALALGVAIGKESKGSFPQDGNLHIEKTYLTSLIEVFRKLEVDKAICIYFLKEKNGKTGRFVRIQTKYLTLYISLLS